MVATLAPGVVFHSPVTFRAFEGRDATAYVLAGVMRVFTDFRYTDQLEAGHGVHALVFRATVGDREVEGIDLVRIGSDGLIDDFTVFVRPSGATTDIQINSKMRTLRLGQPGKLRMDPGLECVSTTRWEPNLVDSVRRYVRE